MNSFGQPSKPFVVETCTSQRLQPRTINRTPQTIFSSTFDLLFLAKGLFKYSSFLWRVLCIIPLFLCLFQSVWTFLCQIFCIISIINFESNEVMKTIYLFYIFIFNMYSNNNNNINTIFMTDYILSLDCNSMFNLKCLR